MFKISLNVLIKILIQNNINFCIERADKNAFPNLTYRFVCDRGYPKNSPYIINDSDDREKINIERHKHPGNVFLLYCAKESLILAVSQDVKNIIESEIWEYKVRKNAIQKCS